MLRREMKEGNIFCFGVTATCLLLYALPFKGENFITLRLALVCLVLSMFAARFLPHIIYLLWKRKVWWPGGKGLLLRGLVISFSMGIGFIFLGNVAVENPLAKKTLRYLGHAFGECEIKTIPGAKNGDYDKKGDATFRRGDFRERADRGAYNEYCKGPVQFVSVYGFILTMILGTNYLFRTALRRGQKLSWQDFALYENFLLAAALIPAFLFFMDFIDIGARTWLKSRFLEIPIYMVMFSFFYFIQRVCGRRQKFFIGLILVVYMVTPFIGTQRHEQIKHNWEIFLALPRG